MSIRYGLAAALLLALAACARQPAPDAPAQVVLPVAQAEPDFLPADRARDLEIVGARLFVPRNLEGLSVYRLDERSGSITDAGELPPDWLQPIAFRHWRGNLFVAADRFRGLVVLDWPASDDVPTSVSQLAVPGIANDVAIGRQGALSYAVVACGGEGVVVVDLSNPSAPRICGRLAEEADFTRMVRVAGNLAFVADNFEGGLRILSLEDPEAPRQIRQINLPGVCDAVDVQRGLVAMGNRHSGVHLLRVVPRGGPPVEGVLPVRITHLVSLARRKDRVRSVRLDGERLYVSNDWGGADIYDIADPADPVLLSERRYPDSWIKGDVDLSCMALQPWGGHLLAASWSRGVVLFPRGE